ncbi:hypothetical protein ABT337_15775 [Saccharopolyspora hirsuta]|uniref:DUF3592 domain-containing protein n=1 Tax=Saccharopolyspora hirsuta TaxID=1837 RepID=A0A5M7C5A5_SACHI|nr:hypothetical protein [Saccharopolyspora hirsuta]KAA5837172.1 hypothetical protein F1721_05025 [Saccharopolyspora hirsuta]
MGRQRGSASVAPILLVLSLLGVVLVGAAVWPLVAAADRERAELRPATATVVESRPCGTRGAGDLVEVEIAGELRRAPFDGCGHSRGQQLPVLVPADPAGQLVVRPATANYSQLDDLAERANWILLTLAGVAGGGYALMLGRR